MPVLRYIFRFSVVFSVVSLIYMLFGWTTFNWPRLTSDLAVIVVGFASGDVKEISKRLLIKR